MTKTKRTYLETAEFYGTLAKIATWDHISTGNPAELEAAYYYTRYSVRAALLSQVGQAAYEADLLRRPNYHDGAARPQWSQLRTIAVWSWERQTLATDTQVAR